MLPTINLQDKNQEIRIFICDSRSQVIGRVKEAYSPSYSINTGKLNELSFTIPLYIDDLQLGRQRNPSAQLLINRAKIRVKYGTIDEMFIIDSIDDTDENEQRNIHAFSLGYELSDKILAGYVSKVTTSSIDANTGKTVYSEVESPIDISKALTDSLQKNRTWSVGYIDPALRNVYRSFSFDSQSPLEYVYQIGEKFTAIITWDTLQKKINAYHPDNYGSNKGFKITDEQYVTSLVKNSTDEEFCTRLFVYGSDGLSINSVNPNGQGYIEDYSYFMSNGQMSQALIDALTNYNAYIGTHSGSFPSLLTQMTTAQGEWTTINNDLTTLKTSLDNAQNLLDIGKASSTASYVEEQFLTSAKPKTYTHTFDVNDEYFYFFKLDYGITTPLTENPKITFNSVNVPFKRDDWHWVRFKGSSTLKIDTYNTNFTEKGYFVKITETDFSTTPIDDVNKKFNPFYWQKLVDAKINELSAKQTLIDNIQEQMDNLQTDIAIENHLSSDQLNELDGFIIEKEYSDDNITDATTLLAEGKKQLQEKNKPQVVFTISLVNFFNSLEEKRNWDKLSIFDTVRIQSDTINVDLTAKIITIQIDEDSISLTIANTKNIKDAQDKFIELLYGTANSTKTIQKKEYTWDDAVQVSDAFNDYLNKAIDATKQKIVAGINENVVIDQKGLRINSPDDPNTYLIANHGVIAITHDNGVTWENALTTDGLVAEKVIGKLIAGAKLVIENENGSFVVTGDKVTISGGSLTIDGGLSETQIDPDATGRWNDASDFYDNLNTDNTLTVYEKKALRNTWNDIVLEHNTNNELITLYFGDNANWQFIYDYNDAFRVLDNYLHVSLQSDGKAILNETNMNNVTQIDYTEFDNFFSRYYEKREAVKVQIQTKQKETTDGVQSDLDGAKADIVYKTELHSTAGTQFMNGNGVTTLYVLVYKGSTDITSTLPNASFVWRKTDQDGKADTAWNNLHIGKGNTIQVTGDEVDRKATFWCDIDIPNA
jgi:hypothetical protein